MTLNQIRSSAVEGALAWAAYGAVETAFVSPLRWVASDKLEYHPTDPAFNAVLLLLYPVLGAIAAAIVTLLTGGRIVRKAGLLSLSITFLIAAGIQRDFWNWTIPLLIGAAFLTVLIVVSEARPAWTTRLLWATNNWWVAGILGGVPFIYRELATGLGRYARLSWIGGYALAITLASVLVCYRVGVSSSIRRRALIATAASVLVVVASLFPREAIRSLPVSGAKNPGQRPNVILITLDTVRADHLGLYGYERNTTPNLARLATDMVLYKNAVAPSEMTLPSHGSIFTGVYASRHGAHLSRDYRWGRPLELPYPTMGELLTAQGYYTAAVAANAIYLRHTYKLDRGFLYYDNRWPVDLMFEMRGAWLRQIVVKVIETIVPLGSTGLQYRRGSQITDDASGILDRAKAKNRPFFLFVNYMDAHFPCAPPEPYRDVFPGRQAGFTRQEYFNLRQDVLALKRGMTAAERANLFSQYDGALLYLDSEVNRLVAKLRASGLYDNTMIVITADHGEAFGERNFFEHASMAVYQFLVGVPLLIKYPHSEHRGVSEERVSLVDLLPTIFDVLGYDPPPGIDGRSLLATPPDKSPAVLAEMFPGMENELINPRYGRHQRAIYSGSMKYIQATDGTRELYDLSRDPHEKHDLYASEPEVAKSLEAGLHRWLAANPPRPESARSPEERSQIDRLRSLGYVQ